MLWIILFVVAIIVLIRVLINKEFLVKNAGCGDEIVNVPAFISIVYIIIFLIFFLTSISYWTSQNVILSETEVLIRNKEAKIELMKQTFIQQAFAQVQLADLVNQNLAVQINEEIINLEKTIAKFNLEILNWRAKYRLRALSFCFIKPKYELIEMKM